MNVQLSPQSQLHFWRIQYIYKKVWDCLYHSIYYWMLVLKSFDCGLFWGAFYIDIVNII